MSDLTINISRLSEGAHHYTFEVEANNVGLDPRFKHHVRVQADLAKSGHQMHLRADIQTTAYFTCDRCLDEFQGPLSTRFEIVYLTEESPGTPGSEEVQYLSPDTNVLDLGEDVRQFLILAVPQKLLCKDDCCGLCPKCGSNKNKVRCNCLTEEIDPRWEVLKKMSLN